MKRLDVAAYNSIVTEKSAHSGVYGMPCLEWSGA